MNPGDIAPLIFAVVLILAAGGVPLLTPVAKRLGDIVEFMSTDSPK